MSSWTQMGLKCNETWQPIPHYVFILGTLGTERRQKVPL